MTDAEFKTEQVGTKAVSECFCAIRDAYAKRRGTAVTDEDCLAAIATIRRHLDVLEKHKPEAK